MKIMIISDGLINHPGRIEALQYYDKHCIAATPPSKGGETYTTFSCNRFILSLKAMVLGMSFFEVNYYL